MTEQQPVKEAKSYNLDKLITFFLSLLALFMIMMSVKYWLMLIGFPNPDIRFDTMPTGVRLVTTSLSILMPIAALGLWGGYSWGVAMWIVAVVIELLAYLLIPIEYRNPGLLALSHLATFLVFCIYYGIKLKE